MSRVLTISALLTTLVSIGALGLKLLHPDASWLDALYMAIITLTTVGFEETIPLSPAGRVFLICYLVVGLSVFTYSLSLLGQFIISVQLRSHMERRRMQRRLENLSGHFIVCGLGRMGLGIAEHLTERKQDIVIVDLDEEMLEDVCGERNWLYVVGDAADDDALLMAGILKAKALATALPTDADNIYVTLSARNLCSHLQIISRASDDKAVGKMMKAGASRVVSPFSSGAVRMARFMLNPSIEDFLEVTGSSENLELADVQIPEHCHYVGMPLKDTDLRETGVMIIGIRRANGERLMPPPGSAILEAHDCLFAFGSSSGVNKLVESIQEHTDDV